MDDIGAFLEVHEPTNLDFEGEGVTGGFQWWILVRWEVVESMG